MTLTHEVRLGDGIEGLRMMPAKSVGVLLSDPPYDEHTHSKSRRGSLTMTDPAKDREPSRRAAISRNRDLGFAALTPAQMDAVAAEAARVVTRWSGFFCSLEMISDWRRAGEGAGLQYVRTALWHKIGSTPQFTGDRPAVAAEAIVLFHPRGRKRWNGGGQHGWYEHPPVPAGNPPADLIAQVQEGGEAARDAVMILADWYEERGFIMSDAEIRARHAVLSCPIVLERNGTGEIRLHTTQKPLALMRELVRLYSEPGELVVDWCCGSGTTGLACAMEGRSFLGWEISPEYADIAARRVRCEEARPNAAQPSLFGAEA